MDTVKHMEKISSGLTFTDILNLCCDLDLKHSNPIFPWDTPACDAVLLMLYYQTKFTCEQTCI